MILKDKLVNKIINFVFSGSFIINLVSFFIARQSRKLSKIKTHNYSHLFCIRPWTFLSIGEANSYHTCCSSWMPISAGRISQDPIKIWNSKNLQKIRKSILDGSFSYCNERCPFLNQPDIDPTSPVKLLSKIISDPEYNDIITHKKLTTDKLPEIIHLNNEISCQLSCPQCRPVVILNNNAKTREVEIASKLLPKAKILQLSGAGDPLASPSYRNFLQINQSSDYPELGIYMITNGLLLKKYWHTLGLKDSFSAIQVSVDATTKEVYEVIRRGGRWETLQENLKFLADLKEKNVISQVHLSFVVQEKNWRQMPDFIEMTREFGFEVVIFQLIRTYLFYNKKSSVWHKNHPEHNEFVESLRNPIFNTKNPNIVLGDLLQFMPKQVEQLDIVE